MAQALLALLSPKVLLIYGPMAVMCIALSCALKYLFDRHQVLHEARLADLSKMKDEYIHLVQSVERTLDILIGVLGRKEK